VTAYPALELRKIVVVGYSLDAPDGAPLLDGEGMPVRRHEHPVLMRVAFWVPQAAPFRRRPMRTTLEYLRSCPDEAAGKPLELVGSFTALDYAHLMREPASVTRDYTLVLDASPFELQALRDGRIEEQIADFTFSRQPEHHERRALLLPHWERRTVLSLGVLPNALPLATKANPGFMLTPIVGEA